MRRGPIPFYAFLGIVVVSAALTIMPAPRAEIPRAELTQQRAQQRAPRNISMLDGDTLIDRRAHVTYRVANIDTPEAGDNARCIAERQHAARATAAARRLVTSAQQLDIRSTGRIDRYGRTVAYVLIDGRDLGEALIAEGLARPWRGRREPWCGAGGRLIR